MALLKPLTTYLGLFLIIAVLFAVVTCDPEPQDGGKGGDKGDKFKEIMTGIKDTFGDLMPKSPGQSNKPR